MRKLKDFLAKDLEYKIIALFMAFMLWGVVVFSSRSTVVVDRFVEVINPKEGYEYRLRPEKVRITVSTISRLAKPKFLNRIRAYIDAKELKAGRHKAKVYVELPLELVMKVITVEPPSVKLRVKRKKR
jgi:YbbR domain-containing protein